MVNGVLISQAADLVGLSVSTLRVWEAEGKIPEPARLKGNWRVYSQSDLIRIQDYKQASEKERGRSDAR